MIKCISHKKVFPTREIAQDALLDARSRFEYGTQAGPIAVYQCDDCGNYHLTSRGPMDPKLEEAIKSGKIKLQKEANRWLDKIGKK